MASRAPCRLGVVNIKWRHLNGKCASCMLNDKHNGADSTWNKREYVQDLVNTRAKKTRKDQKVMDLFPISPQKALHDKNKKEKPIITYLSFFSQIQRSWINDAETTIEAEGHFCGCELSWQSTVEKVYLVYILSGLLCYCGLSWKLCISFISFKGGQYSACHT